MANCAAAVATLTISCPQEKRAPGVFEFRKNQISHLSDNPEHCYGAVQFGFHPQNPCQISSIPHPSLDGLSTPKQELPGGKTMTLQLNDIAPDFEAETTEGKIR